MIARLAPEIADVLGETLRAELLERQLLACCMRSCESDGDGLYDVLPLLTTNDFAAFAHGLVFGTILDLHGDKAPVSAASVFERMSRAGTVRELGPKPHLWLADTLELERSDSNARYYANIVAQASQRRKLRHAGNRIQAITSDPLRPVADATAEAEQILFAVAEAADHAGPRTAADLAREALTLIDSRASGEQVRGVATGFVELDNYLIGLMPGQLVILGARPGVGKTAFALALASNAIMDGVPTMFFSMEMPAVEITNRALAMRSDVGLRSIQSGRLTDVQAGSVNAAANRFSQQPFHLDDSAEQTAARIAATVRRAIRRHGIGLVVIDYLQLIAPENMRDNRTLQVGLIARRLKIMARACEVPVVVLCQLNREVENRPGGKPRLSDLRDSGEIEQHADNVIFLQTQPNQNEHEQVCLTDLIVAKNRNGPIGEFTLAYRRTLTRFENCAH